jgi:HK97 gp10 family phage protein
MGWQVKRNDFARVATRLRPELEQGIDAVAEEMMNILRPIVWFDTGVLRGTIKEQAPGKLTARVWVGVNTGRGFYAAYQEFGTSRQAPRPIVGPTAHLFEPRYAQRMTAAVRTACR